MRTRSILLANLALVLSITALPMGLTRVFTLRPEASMAVRGAVTSLAMSAIGLLLGCAAFVTLGRASPESRVKGRAINATVVSGIALLLSIAALPAAETFDTSTRKLLCLSNMRELSRAISLYEEDHAGNFPLAGNWTEAVLPYLRRSRYPFVCPEAPDAKCGYAYNRMVSGAASSRATDPGLTVVLFESDAGWDTAGGPELLPDVPRHFGGDNYGFADGSARFLVPRKKLPDGTWAKEPDADWVIWKPVLKKDAKAKRR